MKFLLALAAAVALAGCTTQTDTVRDTGGYEFKVITIQGCEYIAHDRSLTHKGNCKNPHHKDNQ